MQLKLAYSRQQLMDRDALCRAWDRGQRGATCFRKTDEAQLVINALLAAMEKRNYVEQDVFAVHLALEEAIANAIKHGNHGETSKCVEVEYKVTGQNVIVAVKDEGAGFDPAQIPDPRLPENQAKPSGRGLLLMREFMTWVRFNGRGNQVTLCRRRTLLRDI